MGRKKALKPDDWKQARVRRGWVELVRQAYKKNPAFSPTCDLATASEPEVIHTACQVASMVISGWLWDQLTPHIDQIVDRARHDAAIRTAAHFGGTVVTNDDGSLTVIAPGKKKPAHPTVPVQPPHPRPTMFN